MLQTLRSPLARLCIAGLITTAPTAWALDENSNGLSDVWEQRFNASALLPEDDEDGDGFSNFQECVAGTDPFDAEDKPDVQLVRRQDDPSGIWLSFETETGKLYSISQSADLTTFSVVKPTWIGDGGFRKIFVSDAERAETKSPVRVAFWADVAGGSLEALAQETGFSGVPDGIAYQEELEAPPFLATGYGGLISAWIEIPTTGDYRFHLSSAGPAALYLRKIGQVLNDDTASARIAEVQPLNVGLEPGEWTTYASQASELITLQAGDRYQLEMWYVATEPNQHCEVGWALPGEAGIQRISSDHLATILLQNEHIPSSDLLFHDHDSTGQTGLLWPNNTTLVTGIDGMPGTAERITGDVGSYNEERIEFLPGSSDHLYATWLFQMNTGHDRLILQFMNGSDGGQEGPRIRLEEQDSDTFASVRSGGSYGGDVRIDLDFDKTFRVEIVATLAEAGFEYATPAGLMTVPQDRFDLYVSDASGQLISSALGLTFTDENAVEAFSALRAFSTSSPNLVLDEFEFTSGRIPGNGFLVPTAPTPGHDGNFFRLEFGDIDQDGDGIPDWEELELAEFEPILFFDPETTNGIPDADAIQTRLQQAQGTMTFALFATDAAAFESNYPNTVPDNGQITITREGALSPMEVTLCIAPLESTGSVATVCDGSCCVLVGSAGDEEAEPEDYQLVDEDGKPITDRVLFEFGETTKVLTVRAVDDAINEYPETLNIALAPPAANAPYEISDVQNGASIQIFDLPENPDNVTIFTGTFSQDGSAVVPSGGSGFLTATINGPRTELRLYNEFSGLTSVQQDSHVHKSGSNGGAPLPGPIIYEITEVPGDPETDPLNGPLVDYPWDLRDSSGAIPTAGGSASKQVIIDSLFGQNGESPLYLNIHTVDNPAGEIWAFLKVSGGSATDPGDAEPAPGPGSPAYPLLSGDELVVEVRRFLNQATFGAREEEVHAIVASIENQRVSDPDYHRHEAFEAWIEEQMNPLVHDQTYILDYVMFSHFQLAVNAGVFDPALNPSRGDRTTPALPVSWPMIDRSSPDPEHWYLTELYPVSEDALDLAVDNGLSVNSLRNGGSNELRHALWNAMISARDQLRQKTGFALQQIVVVSTKNGDIRDNVYGAASYQDMLNSYAFSHYRNVLGSVNWSPIMGKWLSSLQNQKAIDFDGDGFFDSYPDENLARENKQLFSIGLFDLWSDGTLKLTSEGLPKPTYTNDDIREFARVLTGQSFSRVNEDHWGGTPFVADNEDFGVSQGGRGISHQKYHYPMKMFGEYHDPGVKHFAGTTIDNTAMTDLDAQGIQDIEDAIDWLAGIPGDGNPDYDMVHSHVSTPAFISRRLIQRFTTSNPSRDYLHRVATVFKNSEGHLGQTVKAILLDPEARNLDLDNTTLGLKKSPLEAYFQVLRSLGGGTLIAMQDPQGAEPYASAPGNYSNPQLYLATFGYPADQLDNFEFNTRFLASSNESDGNRGLQMDPFGQDTVFNFYLPDFAPNGVISEAALVAPELQLANEPDVVRNINVFEDIARTTTGSPNSHDLGGSSECQEILFQSTEAGSHDSIRLPRQALADAFYPAVEPTPINGRTGESLADEALVDELDRRLTNGMFKMRYPYDPSDDDDPNVVGFDDLLKNPREIIIDALTAGYDTPYDNDGRDDDDRLGKFSDALYLLTISPEFQIRK